MKRSSLSALALALMASLLVAGVATARSPHPDRGNGHQQRDQRPAALWVKANAAHPGGTLRILALVKAPVRMRPASVDAIVHFASGDVAVTLTRHGRSNGSAYHGSVPVAATEAAGEVKIDATSVVGGATLNASGRGKIVGAAASGAADETAGSAEPSGSAEASPPAEPPTEPDGSDESDEASDEPEDKADHVRAFVAVLLSLIAAFLG